MAKRKNRKCFSAIISIVIAVLVGTAIFQSMKQPSISMPVRFSPVGSTFYSLGVFAVSFISMILIGLVVYYILVNRREEVN